MAIEAHSAVTSSNGCHSGERRLRHSEVVDVGSHELDELAVVNRELQDTNERLVAALEELQGLNLALQSVNDALHGTNTDLRSEVESLRGNVVDLSRMLNAVGVGTVLVDGRLALRNYNALALRFMTLTKSDIGRSLCQVRHDFWPTPLVALCRQALASGERVECQLTSSEGETVTFMAREVPLDGAEPGLLLTFSLCREPTLLGEPALCREPREVVP